MSVMDISGHDASENAVPLDLDGYVFFWIGQIDNLYARQISRALRRFDVNLTCWRALALLQKIDELTVSQLSELTAIERSSLGRTIDVMEQKGLLLRTENPDDRRMQNIQITGAGRALYEEIVAVVEEVKLRVTWNTTPDEISQCIATLKKIRSNMSDGALLPSLR
jgi:DNA-binding MarR family transcriptional regulator